MNIKELKGATVEFDIEFSGTREKAIGVFSYSGNEENGTLSLEILRNFSSGQKAQFVSEIVSVPADLISKIQRHPDSSVADYLLKW